MIKPVPEGAGRGMGFIPGVRRLGILAVNETDASLGATNPRKIRRGDGSTALPSGFCLASTRDEDIAFAAGALVGSETRDKSFNVPLIGGASLT